MGSSSNVLGSLILEISLPAIWFGLRIWILPEQRARFWILLATTAILVACVVVLLVLEHFIAQQMSKDDLAKQMSDRLQRSKDAWLNLLLSVQCSTQCVLLALGPSFDV
jgi:hypothetical protein